jgi:triacylglycerol lipase
LRSWMRRLAAVVLAGLVCVGAGGLEHVGSTEPTPRFPAPEAVGAGVAPDGTEGVKRSVDVPVLLVPGWFETGRDLAALRIHLMGSGWRAVETITFAEATGSNRDHAVELGAAIDELLQRTGAAEVDIVAHSMGGLATRWYLLGEHDPPVRRIVFIASPHRGTLSAHFAWGEGRPEMMPDSPFLEALNTSAPVPPDVEAITIRTSLDTHIVPGESATLPGVTDHLLCCPTHAGLLRDDEVFEIVRRFLEGGAGP